jgi:lipopolysaccharide transport system permease protein
LRHLNAILFLFEVICEINVKAHYKVINSEPQTFAKYLADVWKYKSLIRVLVIRDLKIQYAQTFMGFAWAIIQPMVAVLIYSLFFYKIIGIQTGNVPYPLFVLTGILVWFNFTKIMNEAGAALASNRDLIKKVEFPKFSLLLVKIILSLIDVSITFIILIFLMLYFKYPVSVNVLFFPLFLLLNQLVGLAVALWLSALTVRFRDFFHIIPFLISFGIWITPVFYPTTILPHQMEYILAFNPLATVAALYRWSILGLPFPSVKCIWSMLPVVFLLITGFRYFLKIEDDIVDYI